MRVAIIHYWFVTWRGGERVVERILRMFPDATVYTHVVSPQLLSNELAKYKVRTTWISRLPFARRLYQLYLPLMPLALEAVDLSDFDLIISSESGPAKNVITPPDSVHVCYCHSPMRYAWDMFGVYSKKFGRIKLFIFATLMHYMRIADVTSAPRVDYFISNSDFVGRRIRKFLRREARTIYPPVAVDDFELNDERSDYFLYLGQLTAYKNVELLVNAFNASGRPLVVIGEGELSTELSARAKSNISLLGRQPLEVVKQHLSKARALIFPGIEDFGIVPVEAMACGTPVIALDKGGARETVVSGLSGVLFPDPSVESLNSALEYFESCESSFDPAEIRSHALKFSEGRFDSEFLETLRRVLPVRFHSSLPTV